MQIASCGTTQKERDIQVADRAKETMAACIKSPDTRGKKAECAENFYKSLGRLSDDDYGKLPALRMATSLYALFIKIDRHQISEPEFKLQMMQITNDFKSDLQIAEQISNIESAAAAVQQQQNFQNVQKMLSSPTRTVNCFRAPGSPVVTCN